MAWTKLDDRFWCHPKVMGLDDRAFRLYVVSLNWSVANLTDGHVPRSLLRHLSVNSRNNSPQTLVERGLWKEHETDGFIIHDFEQYQPTKSAIRQQQQQGRDRQRRFRERQPDPDVTRDVTRYKRVDNARRPDPTPLTTPNGVAEPSKPTKSDPVFDAVYEATTGRKWEPGTKVTAAARGRMNTAAKQLRDIGATPGQVTAAATRYRDEWPDMELTPMALVTNWDRFTGEATARCNHRWSDGRTAWSVTTRGGVDMTRCDKCNEVKP